MKKNESTLKLYDQANGYCPQCRWNESPSINTVRCACPPQLLRNPYCMAKLQLILSQIMVNEMLDEGDWKNGATG